MKYCPRCGAEVSKESVYCSKCGFKVDETALDDSTACVVIDNNQSNKRDDDLLKVAFVFCIISIIFTGFAILPLCWMIPLTICLYNKIQKKEPISIAFKIVILFFVNIVAGILLLVGDENI